MRVLLVSLVCFFALSVSASAKTPVFVLVLDEMPASVVMDRQHGINARDFPSLAGLSRQASWYRNHTAVAGFTTASIPAMIYGQYPSPDPGPENYGFDSSHSLFELLRDYKLNVWQSLNPTCGFCPRPRPSSSLAGASLRQGVGYQSQNRYAAGALKAIDGDSELTFIHFILPHVPWEFLPDGSYYRGSLLGVPGMFFFEWDSQQYTVDFSQQRMYLQARFADRVVGDFLGRIKKAGLWDSSMVVVTADHGVDFMPLYPRRGVSEERFSEIANVPMFVKYPGQKQGRVSDLPSNHTQVLPTINQFTANRPDYQGLTLDQTPPGQKLAMRPWDQGFVSPSLEEMVAGRGRAIALRYSRLTDQPFPSLKSQLPAIQAARKASRVSPGRAGLTLSKAFDPRRGMIVADPRGMKLGDQVIVSHRHRILGAGEIFNFLPAPQNRPKEEYRLKLALLINPAIMPRRTNELRFDRLTPEGREPIHVSK